MSAPHVALHLPAHERVLLRSLVAPWRDLLYAPGPGFTSPLDPGAYRTSIVIVPATGPAVRLSSVVMPAFGGELCRLRSRHSRTTRRRASARSSTSHGPAPSTR